ncbi:MAG: DUF962 domain-containing protein [Deltaproteobacteria bacterium]|nr:DUF962 domain-containing protein [Deltaproteobacteria bacterium]
MAQRNIHEWLEAYGESHQNKTNKLIHWICVPGIFLTIAGLLWAIPVPEFMAEVPYLNWGTLTLVPIILFYLRLSAKLAAGMTLFSIACVAFVAWYAEQGPIGLAVTCLFFFVAFWILQFAGHKIEGKKPSFMEDLQFLLIGPAWVIGFTYRKLGIQF